MGRNDIIVRIGDDADPRVLAMLVGLLKEAALADGITISGLDAFMGSAQARKVDIHDWYYFHGVTDETDAFTRSSRTTTWEKLVMAICERAGCPDRRCEHRHAQNATVVVSDLIALVDSGFPVGTMDGRHTRAITRFVDSLR